MSILMGIAPSQRSRYDAKGRAESWCPESNSGRKVEMLADRGRLTFANASDTRPGIRVNRRNQSIDKTPSRTAGYERLCSYAEAASPEDPVDILLLGLNYWKSVSDMAARLERLTAPRFDLPVARAMPFSNAEGRITARLFLFPHPRNWPQPADHAREAYRAKLLSALESQKLRRSRKASAPLVAADYDTVLRHFAL